MQDDRDLWTLFDAWFAGSITPSDQQTLERRLREDPQAAKLFVSLSRVEHQLPQVALKISSCAPVTMAAVAFVPSPTALIMSIPVLDR